MRERCGSLHLLLIALISLSFVLFGVSSNSWIINKEDRSTPTTSPIIYTYFIGPFAACVKVTGDPNLNVDTVSTMIGFN